MAKQTRYTATITVYLYTDIEEPKKAQKDIFKKAKKITKKINTKFGGEADIETMHLTPFGVMCLDNTNEIDLKTLRPWYYERELKQAK